MEGMKNANSDLWTRRQFFKKALSKALPIIGLFALTSVLPLNLSARKKEQYCKGCWSSCASNCSGTCDSGCKGCGSSCSNTCSSTCKGSCEVTCKGSCENVGR